MPLYFAYGSNMDAAAMRRRCPKAQALGRGCLKRHRFVLMGNGYASVQRDPRIDVHGVLFDLALSDVPALDRYEEVGRGLYTKAVQPILREGRGSARALVYFGADRSTGGTPPSGYMEAIVAAAEVTALPAAHIAHLQTFLPRAGHRGLASVVSPRP